VDAYEEEGECRDEEEPPEASELVDRDVMENTVRVEGQGELCAGLLHRVQRPVVDGESVVRRVQLVVSVSDVRQGHPDEREHAGRERRKVRAHRSTVGVAARAVRHRVADPKKGTANRDTDVALDRVGGVRVTVLLRRRALLKDRVVVKADAALSRRGFRAKAGIGRYLYRGHQMFSLGDVLPTTRSNGGAPL